MTCAWFELKLKTDQRFAGLTLELDYRGVPTVVHAAGAARGGSVQQFVESRSWAAEPGRIGRGECDIKAYSWLPLARCLCIVSVDCDFLPLSLLQGLACSRAQAGAGADADAPAREILLFRMVRATCLAWGRARCGRCGTECSTRTSRSRHSRSAPWRARTTTCLSLATRCRRA